MVVELGPAEPRGIDPKWRLHDLRHWTATAAIGSGHDVRTVAGRLGHANPAMTMRVYAHVVEGADEALASTLGQGPRRRSSVVVTGLRQTGGREHR